MNLSEDELLNEIEAVYRKNTVSMDGRVTIVRLADRLARDRGWLKKIIVRMGITPVRVVHPDSHLPVDTVTREEALKLVEYLSAPTQEPDEDTAGT